MPLQYSVVFDDERVGPGTKDDIILELAKKPAPLTAQIIIHERMGDRYAPLSAFPEFSNSGRVTETIQKVPCPDCQTRVPRVDPRHLKCSRCGCHFQTNESGMVVDKEYPKNTMRDGTLLLLFAIFGAGVAFDSVWALGTATLSMGIVGLAEGITQRLTRHSWGHVFTMEEAPIWFGIAMGMRALIAASGALILITELLDF